MLSRLTRLWEISSSTMSIPMYEMAYNASSK